MTRPRFLARHGLVLLAAGLVCAVLLSLQREVTRPRAVIPNDVCLVSTPYRYDPGSGLALLAAREVPADARCPVCGMYPARARAWAAQLIFANGDAYFFDSPVNLYLYLQDVGRYSQGRRAAEVAASYVTDALSGAWVPAEQAYYVQGSSALGPMRQGNLPAFADAAEARQFMRQRGGEVLRADQISPALLARLDTRRSHDHGTASIRP